MGDVHEVRRYYVQNGKVIPNSHASILGDKFNGNSITDAFCDKQKDTFEDDRDFQRKGGLKTMSEALDRGMVLVMSLWDDTMANMLWLDSAMGSGGLHKPGVLRGPCSADTGKPEEMRQKYPTATVSYMNIKYGEINSTFNAGTSLKTLGFSDVPSKVTAISDSNEAEPKSHLQEPALWPRIAAILGALGAVTCLVMIVTMVKRGTFTRTASTSGENTQQFQRSPYQRIHNEASASGHAVPEV